MNKKQTIITLLAGTIIGYGIAQWKANLEAKVEADNCNPNTHQILPQECMTQDFFDRLNGYVTQGNYEAAVESFLNPKEREYAGTLGANYDAEEHLLRRLDLQAFLADTEICGTQETPSCEELFIDPSCGCPKYDYSSAKEVIGHIQGIAVQSGMDATTGRIEVTFDRNMPYVIIDGANTRVKTHQKGEPYLTTFTPHWDYEAKKSERDKQ